MSVSSDAARTFPPRSICVLDETRACRVPRRCVDGTPGEPFLLVSDSRVPRRRLYLPSPKRYSSGVTPGSVVGDQLITGAGKLRVYLPVRPCYVSRVLFLRCVSILV